MKVIVINNFDQYITTYVLYPPGFITTKGSYRYFQQGTELIPC
nr:MAG TPA_asm: hypothetical protein [Caudoviricetes sp.]